MGRVASKFTRRIDTRFNIENRAQKVIQKQQTAPNPPPKFESSAQILKQIQKDYPNLKEENIKKNEDLYERLKQVRIESHGPPPEIKSIKNLPTERTLIEEPEFGHLIPNKIRPGHLSMVQLMKGLEKSLLEPKKYTHEAFAEEFNLDISKAKTIFDHFKTYHLVTDWDSEKMRQEQIAEIKENYMEKLIDPDGTHR